MKRFSAMFWFLIMVYSGFSQSLIPTCANGELEECCDELKIFIHDGTCRYSEYVLVYEDDFNGPELDLSNWNIHEAAQGDYTNVGGVLNSLNNVEIEDGILRIITRRQDTTALAVSWLDSAYIHPDGVANLRDFSFTSANLWSNKMYGHGRYETRFRLASAGRGFNPAFWLFGEEGWNEIDIFEHFPEREGSQFDQQTTDTMISSDMHLDSEPDENDNYSTQHCGEEHVGVDYTEDFHTVAIEWDFYSIRWFIDGNLVRTSHQYTDLDNNPRVCSDVLDVFDQSIRMKSYPLAKDMRIIFSLGVNPWPDDDINNNANDINVNDESVFPHTFEIDYVRFYKAMDCPGPVVINDQEDLLLDGNINGHPLHNTLLGTSVEFDSPYYIDAEENLTIVARDFIDLGPDFDTHDDAQFETFIDETVCAGKSMGLSNDSYSSDFQDFDEPITIKNVNQMTETGVRGAGSLISMKSSNPFKDQIRFDLLVDSGALSYYLTDVSGKRLTDPVSISSKTNQINAEILSVGTYFLIIYNEREHVIVDSKILFKDC